MGLSDLVAGHAAPEPVGSGLHSLVRPVVATVVEPALERPNLPRMMNELKAGRPAPKPHPTTEQFDHRGMAQRLAARRRALEATFMPDHRKWARLSAYEEYLMETSNE